MSFDGLTDDPDGPDEPPGRAGRRNSDAPATGQEPDKPGLHRSADAGGNGDAAVELPRLLTREERIEAHQRSKATVEAAYAGWNRQGRPEAPAATGPGGARRPDAPPDTAEPQATRRAPAESRAPVDGGVVRQRPDTVERQGARWVPADGGLVSQRSDSAMPQTDRRAPVDGAPGSARPDSPSAAEEVLRKQVSELEADKAALSRKVTAQDAKLTAQARIITEQGERLDRLEAYVGQVTTAVRELRLKQDVPGSSEIGERADSKPRQDEWDEPQRRRRRLPSDTVNNVISLAIGAGLGDLPYHIHDVPPEYAGLGASAVGIGAGIIAVWRESRKRRNDDSHRPKG